MKIRMEVPRTSPLIKSVWGKIRTLGVVKEMRRDDDMEEIWRNVPIFCNALDEICRRSLSEIV